MAGDNAAVTTSLREVLVAETLKKGTRVTGAERDKLAEQLKKRYDSGESIRALAAATGRSYGFIHRILTESGVNLRARGWATRDRKTRRAATPQPRAPLRTGARRPRPAGPGHGGGPSAT